MSIIYYLIPIAIIFLIIGVFAFFWATKSEQFDDLEKQGLSILMDDEPNQNKTAAQSAKEQSQVQNQNQKKETRENE